MQVLQLYGFSYRDESWTQKTTCNESLYIHRNVQLALPWNVFYRRIAVCQEKESWTAHDLAVNLPPVFDDFLGYARGLEYDEEPDYPRWRELFKTLADSTPIPLEHKLKRRTVRGRTSLSDPESDGEDNGKASASSNNNWYLVGSVPFPEGVPNRHVFGDEDALIRENVPLMTQIPVMLNLEMYNKDEKIMTAPYVVDQDTLIR